MRTVKWNPVLAGACMMVGGVLLWAGAARADVTTTNPAAILIFPKLVVDVTADTSGSQKDTIVELTNTSPNPVYLRCFLVNANGHCSQGGAICDPQGPTQPTGCGSCTPGWIERDFSLLLTANQPITWNVSEGLSALPCDVLQTDNPSGCKGQFNNGSIPAASENPLLRGELKCIEVDANDAPINSNDIKGEATIEEFDSTPTADIEGYNAVGIQATFRCHGGDNDGGLCQSPTDCPGTGGECGPTGNTVTLNSTSGDYQGCPNLLVVDHFFDDAIDPTVNAGTITTHLTLVPCTEDFNLQTCLTTVVQYLVYNEFEQRLSTSTRLTCFSEVVLSDIDTRPGTGDDKQSIFNIGVEGTLTGQSVLRSLSEGLVGITQQFAGAFSAAANLHHRGDTETDTLTFPLGSGAATP